MFLYLYDGTAGTKNWFGSPKQNNELLYKLFSEKWATNLRYIRDLSILEAGIYKRPESIRGWSILTGSYYKLEHIRGQRMLEAGAY